MVAHAGVEAELVHHVVALLACARDADHPATLDPGDLADHRAHRPGGGGDHHRLPLLRLSDPEQPHVRGHAGHPEDPDRGRDGGVRGIDSACARARPPRNRMALPAGERVDDVARRESVRPGLDDLAHPARPASPRRAPPPGRSPPPPRSCGFACRGRARGRWCEGAALRPPGSEPVSPRGGSRSPSVPRPGGRRGRCVGSRSCVGSGGVSHGGPDLAVEDEVRDLVEVRRVAVEDDEPCPAALRHGGKGAAG